MTLSTPIKGQEGKESTKVLNGVQTVINTVLQFLYETNTIYACVDYTRPALAIDIQMLKEAFLSVKKRGVKLRYITEITKDNVSYCRELLTMVGELRHLDGIKGNFYLSETGYMLLRLFMKKENPHLKLSIVTLKKSLNTKDMSLIVFGAELYQLSKG